MIRVVLVDDHQILRLSLARMLEAEDDIDVVGTAADGAEALDVVAQTKPDVVLMDLSMPGVDGVEATRRILASGDPAPKIAVLTSFSDRDRILEALDAGAIGYLLKDAEPAELLRAVRVAARGDWPLDPRAARLLLGQGGRPKGPQLSDREQQVLALVVEGLPNKLIGRRLGISERTVKAHLTRIFEQLGVADRTQAALWAERHGFSRRAPRTQPAD